MSTLDQKLNYLNNTKTAIKNALVAKGVSVSNSDTFRSYADKIEDIETGATIKKGTLTPDKITNTTITFPVETSKILGFCINGTMTSSSGTYNTFLICLLDSASNQFLYCVSHVIGGTEDDMALYLVPVSGDAYTLETTIGAYNQYTLPIHNPTSAWYIYME